MRPAMSVISPLIAAPAKGSAISSTTKMATILGTKTRVCSWIWVSGLQQADGQDPPPARSAWRAR